MLGKCSLKPNKVWIDKRSELYNGSMKSQLRDNDIKMHLTYNEGKSVVAERFSRYLKNKIQKYMTAISKIVYIDKLVKIVEEYNNIYTDFDIESNDKKPKFRVYDHVRISKCKKVFAKGYLPPKLARRFYYQTVEKTIL